MKTKMQNSARALAILAIFLMSTIAITLPSTQASTSTYNSYAYINPTPNPVGVGQTVTVLFFLTEPAPTASAGFNAATNYDGYKVVITSPSGKTQNFGPFTSDATGGYFLLFTPNEVGQYKLDFTFPGQTFIKGTNSIVINPSSATANLTVQQEALKAYQTPPLPNNYWTQPIYGENRGWNQISGDWLRQNYNNTGAFNPYTTAPNTAHIVWARNQYMGGLVGGDSGDLNFYQAPTYQSYWVPPIVMNGRLYYMERQVPGNGWVGLHCVDLKTGQELWFRSAASIGGAGGGGGGVAMNIYGQDFDAEGVNGHGLQSFIWNLGTNWTCFDANSGNQVFTVTGVPSGATTASATGGLTGPNFLIGGVDPVGSIIAYYMNGSIGKPNWLAKWNSTQCLIGNGVSAINNLYLPPLGQTLNWTKGLMWNVTEPAVQNGQPGFFLGLPASNGEEVFAQTVDISTGSDNITLCAYSAQDGHQMWTQDFNAVFTPGSTSYEFFGPVKDGVMCIYNKNTAQWYGYSATTGQKMWGPTTAYSNGWDTFENAIAAYGNLYVGTYAGNIYSYNLQTGAPGWVYTLPPGGYETPYGAFPLSGGITAADGKLYAITGEHTPNSPYWLGGAMYCINATDGKGIYSMSGWWSASPTIADAIAADHNCYDGTIYAFGKGETTTTVTAPQTSATLGDSVIVQGKVMDNSPGRFNYADDKIPSAPIPAIADPYMTQWMEYVYQQKQMPTNATGVNVSIDVIDSNGNFRNVGTATSDATGAYSFVWQPDIVGKYTVIASFGGSGSYYSSSSETSVNVINAPTPAATTLQAKQPVDNTMTIVASTIAIIIAIAIVGILLLRKRP